MCKILQEDRAAGRWDSFTYGVAKEGPPDAQDRLGDAVSETDRIERQVNAECGGGANGSQAGIVVRPLVSQA